jgi:hypothetical protein
MWNHKKTFKITSKTYAVDYRKKKREKKEKLTDTSHKL